MPITQLILNRAAELFEHAAVVRTQFNVGTPWWRGQGDATWPLVAAVHRPRENGRLRLEAHLTQIFRASAPARRADCPDFNDAAGWLMLMQHYGLPTRLLDWSEAMIVGLYFAVWNPARDGTDGAVWALDPGALNGALTPNPAIPKPISTVGMPNVSAIVKRALAPTNPPPAVKAVAFIPVHRDLRMMVQHGRCTAHDTPEALEAMAGAENFLCKIIVPAATKATWRRRLQDLGVGKSILFPDLGSLADALKEQY